MNTVISIINYTAYVAIGLLILIIIKTIIDLIRRKRNAWINDFKVLINYGLTLLICWELTLYFALIVRPPVKMESSYDLTMKFHVIPLMVSKFLCSSERALINSIIVSSLHL